MNFKKVVEGKMELNPACNCTKTFDAKEIVDFFTGYFLTYDDQFGIHDLLTYRNYGKSIVEDS